MTNEPSPTTEPELRSPGILRFAALGLLLGAAWCAVEMALRLRFAGALELPVARRSTALVLYATGAGALFGSVTFAVLAAYARFRGRRWTSLVGAGVALFFLAIALVWLDARFWNAAPAKRLGLLALAALVSSFIGGLAAGLAGRFAPRRAPTQAFVFISLALLAGAFGSAYLQRHTHESQASATDTSGENRPNIIVVVVDTLRADALGCYGNADANTPVADRLATEGVLFEEALASSSWTLPSVASLFTSVHPGQHGVVDFNRTMASELETLPVNLTDHGYQSLAVVGNPFLDQPGFRRGFEFFDSYAQKTEAQLFCMGAFSAALRFSGLVVYESRKSILRFQPEFPFLSTNLTHYNLDEDINDRLFDYADIDAQRPLFLYVQYIGPHTPYLTQPLGFLKSEIPSKLENRAALQQRYAGEVAYTDRVVGDLLDRLEARGLLDNAIVVLTSDHGEEFYEHEGWEHGYGLHREVVRIPLILRGPGIPRGERRADPAQLLDLAPTLLGLVGLEPPQSYIGRNLLAAGDAQQAASATFGQVTSRFLNPKRDFFSVATERWKVIRTTTTEGEIEDQLIYDLTRDREETQPLAEAPASVDALLEGLAAYQRLESNGATSELSAEDLQRMQALGYAGGDDEAEERD